MMGKCEKCNGLSLMMADEIERRISVLEGDDYQYPSRLRKTDWFGFALLVVICIVTVLSLMFYCSAL